MITSLTVVYGETRVHIKVSPLMTFAEVCKQAMQLFKIPSGMQCRLRHKRSPLDPSMQIRFATSLPPNACLELITINVDHVDESPVKVIVQTREYRLESNHPPSRYISDVLLSLEAATPSFNIVKTLSNGTILLPVMNISGRSYFIEEWRGLRVCDVSDSKGLLMRLHWEETKLSRKDAEAMFSIALAVSPMVDSAGHSQSDISLDQALENLQNDRAAPEHVLESSGTGREFRFIDPSEIPSRVIASNDIDYDISPVQAKKLYEDAKNRTQRLIDAPLVSRKAVLAKQMADMLSKYPKTIIRVRLLDGRMVEAVFDSTELGESVYRFVYTLEAGAELLISAGRVVDKQLALVDQSLSPKAMLTIHRSK